MKERGKDNKWMEGREKSEKGTEEQMERTRDGWDGTDGGRAREGSFWLEEV